MIALLCINVVSKTVRRYCKNIYGRVWATHEADLGPIHEYSLDEFDEFRKNPPDDLRVKAKGK